MSNFNRSAFPVAAALALATAALGCSSGPGTVSGRVEAHAKNSAAISAGELTSVNGVYGTGCTARSGAWSMGIDGSTAALDNPPLSVVQDDIACVLTVTELKGVALYRATPPIDMTDSYQPEGSSFDATVTSNGTVPARFIANAMLSAIDFSSDFFIEITYSSDVNSVSESANATFATQTTTAVMSSQVSAPDYALDLTGMSVQVDANRVVMTTSGAANLIPNMIAGQTYLVDWGNFPVNPTLADIDTFYTSNTPSALPANIPLAIPSSSFYLEGSDLPATRVVLIANEFSGVRSYQVITITFNGPA